MQHHYLSRNGLLVSPSLIANEIALLSLKTLIFLAHHRSNMIDQDMQKIWDCSLPISRGSFSFAFCNATGKIRWNS